MTRHSHRLSHGFAAAAFLACLGALILQAFSGLSVLPVIGPVPILPATLAAALAGWALLRVIDHGPLTQARTRPPGRRDLAFIGLAGVLLALPPIAIDFALPFPQDMNLPLPGALAFYPAIALVAECIFHLLPLAALSLALPRPTPAPWLLIPVAAVEPLFQAAYLSGAPIQAWLVLANVALISAAQMWIFLRHGFAAMIGVRLAFYLVWHILWGTARLQILF